MTIQQSETEPNRSARQHKSSVTIDRLFPKARRLKALQAIAIIAAIAGAAFLLPRITTFDAPTLASIWVAVGTLALAIVTYISVLQSTKILAAEERRFQYGFAPLVQLRAPIADVQIDKLIAENVGVGPACSTYVNIRYSSRDGSSSGFCCLDAQSIAAGGTVDLPFHSAFAPEQLLFHDIHITYHDVFGKWFRTQYKEFSLTRYKWQPYSDIDPEIERTPTPLVPAE